VPAKFLSAVDIGQVHFNKGYGHAEQCVPQGDAGVSERPRG
jgi:hypothetical protein